MARNYSEQKRARMKNFVAAVSALLMLAGQASAQMVEKAAPAASMTATPQKKSGAKKAVKKTAKATVLPNSAESVAERSARLKRECKGGVNAGACAGYTR